jgi:hypothetical protein
MLQCTREEFREEFIDAIKENMAFENIGKFLPFQTVIVAGYNHNHIQSQSVFAIVTENRIIIDGDTLCGRRSQLFNQYGDRDSNCPGCEAIGRGLAVRDLF